MKKLLIPFLILLFCYNTYAQKTEQDKLVYGWKNKMVGILNFSQSNFDNWAKGGENSWSWVLDFNGSFINDQENYNWANSGKLSYGNTKVGDDDAKKSADEIKMESVFTYKVWNKISPYISATARTQMTAGYEYSDSNKIRISNFFDPAFFTQGIGFNWTPTDNFKTRAGAALKETITESEIASIRFNTGEKTRIELGAEWVTDYNVKIAENIIFVTKLELFSTLKRFDETDVVWDNLFSAKVAEYITASFNLKIVYDKDYNLKRQMKQILSVGLSYSFL